MTVSKIEVVGLKEFRAALRAVGKEATKELSKGIRKAGDPLVAAASRDAPRVSGALAGGYKVAVRTTTGSIVSKVPYAGGAEWGTRGKWRGFFRYGSTPRFAGKALVDNADEVQDTLTRELENIITIYGWAR